MGVTDTYREAIERLYARRPQGEPEEEVRLAEERLGVALPKALRGYYLYAGHREPLNQAQDRLLAPATLRRAGSAVVFYVENQGVNSWGIRRGDLGRDDPPVYAAWPRWYDSRRGGRLRRPSA